MSNKKLNYKKLAGFWALVFLLGGLAGILGSNLLLPWLAGFAPFSKIDWIRQARNGTTIINQTEKIFITPDAAVQEAIARVANSVVGIRSEKHYKIINKKQVPLAQPEILAQGSGFILTSDGAVVSAQNLIPETATRVFVLLGGKEIEAQLAKKDAANKLVLLKIPETNLPVVNLGDSANLKLGETVFLVGWDYSARLPNKFVNLGFIRSAPPNLSVGFNENQLSNGTPLVNIKGEVLGLSLVDKEEVIEVVLTDKIKELLRP